MGSSEHAPSASQETTPGAIEPEALPLPERPRIRLWACMMVRDELDFLPVVLEQLLGFCDRLVVMDNGSTDGSRRYLLWDTPDPYRIQVILNQQGDPPDYAALRNLMLAQVPEGTWVLKWDPDELPSMGLVKGLKDFLAADGDRHTGWTIPIYHLIKDRETCLQWEAAFGHLRLFRMAPEVQFAGAVHEQIVIGDPWGGISPERGMAVVHLSYFAEPRFRRKAEHYATVPGSGFARPEDLTCRLDGPTMPLPPQVHFEADDAWLNALRDGG